MTTKAPGERGREMTFDPKEQSGTFDAFEVAQLIETALAAERERHEAEVKELATAWRRNGHHPFASALEALIRPQEPK